MKNKYLKLSLLTIILCSVQLLQAQRSYSFQSVTGSYAELSNAKRVSWNDFDSTTDLYKLSELEGQTFQFYRLPFLFGGIKTFHLESNGVVRIDNDSTLIIIDGAFTYLDSIDASSSVSYLIEGTPGNYVVKAQWKNLNLRVGQAGNNVNFQIWVYQQTGVIEIHYGPRSANNGSGYNTSTGPQVGMFFSRDNFSICYEKLWVNGPPVNFTLDSVANYTFKAMSGVSDQGTIFRFIPRFMTVGILEAGYEPTEVVLYPNPADGHTLYVSRPGNYKVTDTNGKVCLSVLQADEIDISVLQRGMYFLQGSNGYSHRFIIQ